MRKTGPVNEPLPEVRVGDRERRETDERLRAALDDGVLTLTEYDERAAQCWAARTRADLDVLTRDLPDVTVSTPVPATVAPPTPAGPTMTRRIVGALVTVVLVGGALVLGGRVVGADDGVSVFSSRVVQVGAGQDRVEVGVLFGSTEVVVPDDVRVRSAGTLVFGSLDCELACSAGAGLREVLVTADGAFGSVDVVRSSELGRDRGGRGPDRDND